MICGKVQASEIRFHSRPSFFCDPLVGNEFKLLWEGSLDYGTVSLAQPAPDPHPSNYKGKKIDAIILLETLALLPTSRLKT